MTGGVATGVGAGAIGAGSEAFGVAGSVMAAGTISVDGERLARCHMMAAIDNAVRPAATDTITVRGTSRLIGFG